MTWEEIAEQTGRGIHSVTTRWYKIQDRFRGVTYNPLARRERNEEKKLREEKEKKKPREEKEKKKPREEKEKKKPREEKEKKKPRGRR